MAEDTLISFDNLRKVLKEYGETAAEVYKMGLLSAGRVATGNLQDSVSYVVKEGEHEFEVSLSLADYWRYVEGGAQGTKGRAYAAYPAHVPPVEKIIEWIKVKPVLPRPSDLARRDGTPHRHRDGSEWTLDEIYEKMGWRVSMGIYHHGIEPVPAFDNASAKTFRSFYAAIITALRKDMEHVVKLQIVPAFAELSP